MQKIQAGNAGNLDVTYSEYIVPNATGGHISIFHLGNYSKDIMANVSGLVVC